MNAHADIVIVGAGITGLATAFALSESGLGVRVLERFRPGAMASGWTLAGVRQSGRDIAELPLARRAVEYWATLDRQLEAPTGYRRSGNLRLARNSAEADRIRELIVQQRSLGLEWVDGDRLTTLAPSLATDLVGGSWCADDGQAEPDLTIAAYHDALERRGVSVEPGIDVQAVRVAHGRVVGVTHAAGRIDTPRVVIATGIHVNALLEPLERRLPISLASVTVLQSASIARSLEPVIGVANADLALRQQQDGRLRMTSGATVPPASLQIEDGRPIVQPGAGDIARTIERLIRVMPTIESAPLAAHWGGLLDLTPDARPVLDRVPDVDGLVVAAGFSGHGFGIGPAVGEQLAALILDETPPLSLQAFRFTRFDGSDVADAEPESAPADHETWHGLHG